MSIQSSDGISEADLAKLACCQFYKNMQQKDFEIELFSSLKQFQKSMDKIANKIALNRVLEKIFTYLAISFAIVLVVLVLDLVLVGFVYWFPSLINNFHVKFSSITSNVAYTFLSLLIFLFIAIIGLVAIAAEAGINGVSSPLLLWALKDITGKEIQLGNGVIIRNTHTHPALKDKVLDLSEVSSNLLEELEITQPLASLDRFCMNYILTSNKAVLLSKESLTLDEATDEYIESNAQHTQINAIKQIREVESFEQVETQIREFGVQKALDLLEIKPVSTSDSAKLYRIDSKKEGAWSLAFVHVQGFEFAQRKSDQENSSLEGMSLKDYWLTVPPYMMSAQEAVAWTFRKKKGEYNPVVET